MNNALNLLIVSIPTLLAGCAHSSEQVPSAAEARFAKPTVIVVYVGGAVEKPGKQELAAPFTIEHAIRQAGGLEVFEKNANRNVVVAHNKQEGDYVPRKDYGSFTLVDGDEVVVPRH